MSMKTWVDYGYGIKLNDLADKFNKDKLFDLMEEVDNTTDGGGSVYLFRDFIREHYDADENIWESFEEYWDNCGYAGCYANALVVVIRNKYDVFFTATEDMDGGVYLIFSPIYPWLVDDKHKAITKDKVEEMIRYGVDRLYNDGVADEVEIDFQEAENYG